MTRDELLDRLEIMNELSTADLERLVLRDLDVLATPGMMHSFDLEAAMESIGNTIFTDPGMTTTLAITGIADEVMNHYTGMPPKTLLVVAAVAILVLRKHREGKILPPQDHPDPQNKVAVQED